MTPIEFVEELIDLCASITAVKDYEYDVRDNIVVRTRIELPKGFVDVYRNFETETTAYA